MRDSLEKPETEKNKDWNVSVFAPMSNVTDLSLGSQK